MVTDEIERFTETGILLKSGTLLEADIIVTATGFNLSVLGDIDFAIDGKPLVFSDTVTYRGMMFTGVPNMAWVFGYFRASWTLRADLVADFVCRLLNHMKARGAQRVVTALRPEDRDMPLLAVDRRGQLQSRLHDARACTSCPGAATSRNGRTPRTTGPRRTRSRPSTSTTAPSCTPDRESRSAPRARCVCQGGSASRPSKSASTSSGRGASKSGAIQTRPL